MDINTILLLILILVSLGLGAALFFRTPDKKEDASQNIIDELQRIKSELGQSTSDHRKEVQERLDRVHDQLSRNLMQSQTTMQEQFKQSNEADVKMRQTIQQITEALTEVKSTNKQVLDFSTQLQNLQNILKNPKQRGVLGEYWLETLLGNVMPSKELYQMQYHVGTDEKTNQKLIADAVIFVGGQIIPIDAKFTLENYNRMMAEHDKEKRERIERDFKADVKKRIDEAAKYIRPEFNTTSFAFMFIPAEGVYYNLLNAEVGSGINSTNLVEYAFAKNIMLVSPTSFYAYLQTVLMGLNKLKIEEKTQEIIKRVGELGKHFRSYAEYHGKLGKNLSTVVNQFNSSSNELKKVSKDVVKITSGTLDEVVETENVEKPLLES